MTWSVRFLPEAEEEYQKLDGSVRRQAAKAILKVRQNPLPASEGGYGKPLGSRSGTDLTGLLKIKLKAAGLRIVYKLIQTDTEMIIVVVGARADDAVYRTAETRMKKYDLL